MDPPEAKTYKKVPTSEEAMAAKGGAGKEGVGTSSGAQNEPSIGCLSLYLRGGRLKPEQKAALASRKQQEEETPGAVQLRLHPESIRQIAYAFFWSMCILAMLLTKTLIPPDVIEDSDLKAVFGYNNVSYYFVAVTSLLHQPLALTIFLVE